MTFDFEIKQRGALIGAVEFVSNGLVDGNSDGFSGRLSLVTAVDSHRIAFHNSPPCRDLYPSQMLSPFRFLSVACTANNLTVNNSNE